MSLIIPANTLASGGYAVDNSLRFNSGSNDFLNKTNGTPTNSKKFTTSVWIKRSNLSAYQYVLDSFTDSQNKEQVYFHEDNSLVFFSRHSNSTVCSLKTNRLFRDTAAWYNIIMAIDTTQGTASNRFKIYVNGVQETSFATETYPNQNVDFHINTNNKPLIIGEYGGGGSNYNGYMSEYCLIDGQQLTLTDFGEFDEDSGIWKPIDVSGLTFGNNGFYLDFEDSAALGADVSGNTNNFTVNNLTAIDQTTDTPTNNFCTMNPLDNFYIASTFSEGNCKVVTGSSSHSWNTSTFGLSSGKWYMEFTIIDAGSGGSTLIGITDRPAVNASEELGGLATTYAYLSSGNFRTNNTNTANSVSSTNGDIIGVALDLDSSQNTISYYKNNTLIVAAQNITAPVSGNYFIASGDWLDGDTVTNDHNFGNPVVAHSSAVADGNSRGSFEYAPPSGYLSICTANLSEVLG